MNKKIIHTLFEKQVELNQNEIAVETEQGELFTYEQVNNLANKLAHLLKNHSVAKEEVVAVFFTNPFYQLISLLANFKAGSVYLPIDKKYKENHWDVLYNSIRPKAIMISEEHLETLLQYNQIFDYTIPIVIVIESLSKDKLDCTLMSLSNGIYVSSQLNREWPNTNLNIEHNYDDSNYIFFTSGSTGKPKAVLGCHKSLSHFIHWECNELQINQNDRIALLPSFSFDASLQAIFMALINGCVLCLVESQTKEDMPKLQNWLISKRISVIHLVPTLFRMLSKNWIDFDYQDLNIYPDLRYVLSAGEKLYVKDIKNWRKVHGYNTEVINFYGTTEATILSTFYRIEKDLQDEDSAVLSVGKPISNTVILILNSENEVCRIGEVGSIYIRTPFLSKGYYKDEEQTAEKFIQNPLTQNKEIIYKTGDYGIYQDNRDVLVIGRQDGLVKINGVRIDINSIETTILKIEDVDAVKCLLHQDEEMNATLACFYKSKKLNPEQIRLSCSKFLSQYETPSFIIHMEEFPINANGKIDVEVLGQKIQTISTQREEVAFSGNEIEAELINIWTEVLGIKNIRLNDNFMLLGGNSIKLVKLKVRIHKVFGVELDLTQMFTFSRLFEQAELISKTQKSNILSINEVEKKEFYSLSFAQDRLWVLSQFDDLSVAYNMPFTFQLEENCDILLFIKAIKATIERHEILRTTFKLNQKGEVNQKIIEYKNFEFDIEVVEYSKDKNAKQLTEDFIREDAYTIFDLENGPLIKAKIFKIDHFSYIAYFNMHHIISDGWSINVLMKDVMHFYNAFKSNSEPTLDRLKIQYKDFSEWQKNQLDSEMFIRDKNFWLDSLSGDLTVLNIPTSFPRPKIRTTNGRMMTKVISSEKVQKLKEFSMSHNGSLFVGLVSVLNVLFNRYSGQNDIIIGTSLAGREYFELENQIGFYINTIPLRNKIDSGDSFSEIYNKVKQNVFAASEHQFYPFNLLVSELNLKRDPSRNPLFDVMVTLQNVVENDTDKSLEEFLYNDYIKDDLFCVAKFDLDIYFQEIGDLLSFKIRFNSDLFESAYIENLMDNFDELLMQLVETPNQDINYFNILNKKQRDKLLQYSQVKQKYDNCTIIDAFKKQVEKTPDAIAIKGSNNNYTFKELENISSQFSNFLVSQFNLQKSNPIAIQLELNEYLVIAVLGILKANSFYVPIDVKMPDKRKQYLKNDLEINYIVTDSSLDSLSDYPQENVIFIDKILKNLESYSKSIDLRIDPIDLAYVIYTSGSTGNPKGVMIEHGSLMNYLSWANDYYLSNELNNSDFGLFTSISFDLTVTSLFLPLISGGTLNMFDSNFEILSVLKHYFESDISCIKLTPAHIDLLGSIDLKTTKVQLVIVGGDVLHQKQISILKKLNPSIKIYNEYGPTEATVGCTVFQAQEGKPILIGKPIVNTSIFIVNDFFQLQPEDVEGEICIGGLGLARGYNNQVSGEEKFIDNPIGNGQRIYKTGDLGKWKLDGEIQFMGRKDNQVKVFGNRIELDEIEYILKLKETILEATVIFNSSDYDKPLVAYIVSEIDENITLLREHLMLFLPDYMIPSMFFQLQKMPLTINGKIDKTQLDKHDVIRLKEEVVFVKPKNETEEFILNLWVEVLKEDNISVNENFFSLGGDSIKAIKILHKINQKYQTNINLASLFQYSTIENLAIQIDVLEKQNLISEMGDNLKEIDI